MLAFIAVVGVFNRITFPAFLLFPGLQLLPQFKRKCVNMHTLPALTNTHVLTPRPHQTTLTRSIPPLRPLLFLYRSLHGHDLLPADILPPQHHP